MAIKGLPAEGHELTGQVALVTGGAKNIGRAISLALAAAGTAVAINTLRSREEAESVVREIRAAGGDAGVFIDIDRDEPDLAALFLDHLLKTGGQLPAGPAPGGPEIDEHGRLERSVDDVRLESPIRRFLDQDGGRGGGSGAHGARKVDIHDACPFGGRLCRLLCRIARPWQARGGLVWQLRSFGLQSAIRLGI